MKRMICIAWGGMPAYAVGAIRAFLRTCRDEVRLVATPSDVPRTCPDEIEGVRIDWVADHDSRTLVEVLGREPDVLFMSGWFIPSFNRFASEVRAAGGKVIVGVDNRYVPGLRGFVWNVYFRLKIRPLFDAFLAVGRSGLRLLRRGGVPERILGRGFYSADPERFTAGGPLSGRERKLIFVGRYDARKNILPFARAFSSFRQRHPDWTLECYGQGPLEGELRALDEGVRVFPFLQPDELAAKYRTARAFVLPSLEDHWGVVVHEAALSGCALLLSREVGAAEDFPGAVTFDPQSTASMVDALERMYGWSDMAWASAERGSLTEAQAISPELFARGLRRLSGCRGLETGGDVKAERPLMSLLIMTYNFERYVEECVRGAFVQTYPNLEIVISDDCSTDGTWAIVERLADEYVRGGGRHRVVLNRNPVNRGFVPHFEFAKSLCHGEFVVYNDGDDVSHPDRVAEIARYWEEGGRKHWVVFSGALKVGTDGKRIGEVVERPDNESILGVAAYRRGIEEIFGPIMEPNATQDEVYGNRALMLGPRGSISTPLLKYRIGSGESSGYRDYRRRRAWVLRHREDGSQKQLLRDVETIRDRLGLERYEKWKRRILHKQRMNSGMLELLEGDSLAVRLGGLHKLDFRKSFGQRVLYLVLLLPHGMADFILAIGACCWGGLAYLRRKECEW